ncbi:hypothetical protein F6Y05_14635 [Bacillus megaterium]|nr:hypothetical protein [Priestia megaterium]
MASIGQITAGIAHEIKNPLAILSGSAELLLDEAEESACSEEVKELVCGCIHRCKPSQRDYK